MGRLRFVELREGVWTRPDNLPRESAPPESWATAESQCQWWTGAPDGDADALATRTLRRRAVGGARPTHLDSPGRPDEGACRGVTMARSHPASSRARPRSNTRWRDPVLPAELLPRRWPGADLRVGYEQFQRAFSSTLSTTLGR